MHGLIKINEKITEIMLHYNVDYFDQIGLISDDRRQGLNPVAKVGNLKSFKLVEWVDFN